MRGSRLFHALLTIAAFFAVWVVGERIASASTEVLARKAPLCDARGAITFAPPPQMQDPLLSLDIDVNVDCFGPATPGETRHVTNGHAPVPVDAAAVSREPLSRAATVVVARASGDRVPAPDASTPCPRPGHRSTVDRPPRA
ncbi:MAG: hypothetical protein JST00_35545 [Deltaproteobacteria bacterium]|nr:hypothetical protein [Deltaproteobacteria bacterium]